MTAQTIATESTPIKQSAKFIDYVAIARLDHSTKQIFIVPGIAFALLLRGVHADALVLDIVLGFVSAIAIASANYVINEWLDRDFDRFHPTKSKRSAVQRQLRGEIVIAEWAGLVIIGVGAAWQSSPTMAAIASLFALQGVFYNVAPLRTKDRAYLDVISESVNNPLRLLIGWVMIDPTTLPPSSIILAYWLGGAFLMAAKRLSEYREVAAAGATDMLVRFRASFRHYSEISLTVSCFVYALLSTFFLAIFLIKYRIEYVLTLPLVTLLFAQYLALSMRPNSAAQRPEKLYRERALLVVVAVLGIVFVIASLIDMPFLEVFSGQRFIAIGQ